MTGWCSLPRASGAANATVLAGLLALEEGQVVQAKASFRRALEGGPSFSGWPVAKGCLDWLEER